MNVRVDNKNTDFQLLELEQPITVVIRNSEDEVIYCNHAEATSSIEDVQVVGGIFEPKTESRNVEYCYKCGSYRVEEPHIDEYEWSEWRKS